MLSIKNLCKTYKAKGGVEVHALDNVSIDFAETGMVFLLGKSGSGKSTLLNVIGGLDKCDSGEIIICGRNSKTFTGSDFDSYRNTFIGFIFQEYNILNEFNIEDNIALALQLQGRKNDSEQVEKILEQVDMAGMGKRRANTLSGGQKQRVAIARALVKNPQIIMADEPTGALDSETGKQIFSTLKKLSKEKLVIVVSHDREFAMQYGDRIIELADGKVISDLSRNGEDEYVDTNIVIHDDSFVTIKDPASLTDEDKNTLFDLLKKKKGQVLISTGDNNVNKIKSSFDIDEKNGGKGTFEKTNDVVMKEYSEKDSKLIRSKLPFLRSLKIGASNLRFKPFRLIMTILLTTITFTLFGSLSSLMLFDKTYGTKNALSKLNFGTEVIRKQSEYVTTSFTYNPYNDEKIIVYENDTEFDVLFNDEEVKKFNTDYGMAAYGLMNTCHISSSSYDGAAKFTSYNGNWANNLLYEIPSITGFIQFTEEDLEDNGFRILSGRLPTSKNEIAITKFQYNYLKESGWETNVYDDIINGYVEISFNKYLYYGDDFKIVGVIDTGDIKDKYLKLEDEDSFSLANIDDYYALHDAYLNEVYSTFVNVSFVSDGFYETFIQPNLETPQYMPGTLFGTGFSYSYSPRQLAKHIVQASTPVYFYMNKSKELLGDSLKFYDLDKKVVPFKEIARDEVLLPYEYANILGREKYFDSWRSKIKKIDFSYASVEAYDQLSYSVEELRYFFNYYLDSFYGNGDIESSYLYFINNFTRNYYIYQYGCVYSNYLSANNKENETLDGYLEQMRFEMMSGELYQSTVETLYNYLLGNDDFLKNFDLFNYYIFADTIEFTGVYSFKYQIQDLYIGEHIAEAKQELEEIKTLYEIEKDFTFSPVTSDFKTFAECEKLGCGDKELNRLIVRDSDYKLNFLKVVGYYKDLGVTNNFGDYYLYLDDIVCFFNDEFVRENLHGDSTDANVPQLNYRTKYVEENEGKYFGVIVKTKYTIKQVKAMIYQGKGYHYLPSNVAYEEVNFFASIINVLSIVFLCAGLVMGGLAGLLLGNFIALSISHKKKEIGILRAVGARGADVQKIFFSESSIISILCVILSSIVSVVIVSLFNKAFTSFVSVKVIEFNIINVLIIVAIAAVITFLATFFPVLKHTKKPPVDAIRSL